MALGTTTWLQAAPVVLVALLLLVAPGGVAARLAGARWSTALAIGPLLSTSAIVLGGVLAGVLGTSWGAPALAACLAALLVVGGVVGLVLRSRPEPVEEGRPVVPLLVGTLLSAVVVTVSVVWATGRPTAFPQSPDTIYHLGTVRWMLDEQDVSTLHAGGFASVSGTGFYPAAFHAVVTTVAQLTGASPVVATSAVVLAVSAVVWPLGLLLLARKVVGGGWGPSLATALAAVAFSGFPYWLMGYGVLWPNLFGQALLPAALALLLAVVDGPRRARSLVLGLLSLPGLAVAHPNALIAFVLIGTVVVVLGLLSRAWLLRRSRRWAAVGTATAALLTLLALGAVWAVMTTVSVGMRESNPEGPEMTVAEGVVDVLFQAPRAVPPAWVAGSLVLVGLLVLLARRRHLWVVLAHLMVTGLYVAVVLVDSPATRLLTWPWYNNSPRLGALMVLTAALLTAVTLTELGALLARLVARRSSDPTPLSAAAGGTGPVPTPTAGPARSFAAAAAVAVVFAVATAGLGVGAHRQVIEEYFAVPAEDAWASEADLQALRTLGARVPAGEVVAANPWKGGSYLYLTSDRRMLFPTEKAWAVGDRELLGADLDRAAEDPAVCEAARRQDVGWVLTGGSSMTDSTAQERRYAGVDGVGDAAGFSLVDRAGDYALYRLDACSTG